MQQRDVQIAVRVETGEATSALERVKRALGELRAGWDNAVQQGAGRAWIQSLADLSAAVNLAQGAFAALSSVANEFYSRAIAQNLELERLVLSSATAIAGTNRVFREGLEVEGPTQKIQSLLGSVERAFDYIREETFKLSGVTSNEVIPLFEVLATQIGNVGGSIQDAADLAVKFAAGLGVIGLPLVQARQEITSILTGTIDINSQLAKTLGITNEQVRLWQSQGRLVEELNARLETFMAGNELQANTLAGITSNIQELVDEFFRLMGAPVVEPLMDGARQLYTVLLENRELLQQMATAIGERLGAAFRAVVELVGDVGTKLGTALTEALGRFDLEKLERLLVNVGRVAEAAALGLAEVGSWVIRLSGELLPPLINLVSDLLDTTLRGYQALIDLGAVLAGGLTGEQVEALDAAQALAQEFGNLVDKVVNGTGVATEEVEQFRQRMQALAEQGVLAAEDVEYYNQALARLEEKNRALADSNDIALESLQAAAVAARRAAEEYKRAVAEAKLEQLTGQLELQERINAAELTNAQEIARAKLELERQNNQAILEAARQRLQVLLQDEQNNRDAIIETRTAIAQAELKLAELVQQEKELQYRQEEERVRALAELRRSGLELERAELERRRELIADTVAALEREGQVAAAQAEARQAALQGEIELARAAQQRAQGTAQAAEATQRLAQLQAQAARKQAAAQQQELERQRQLIELRHQGALAALELQQRETASRTEAAQAELELLRQRQAIMGALTEQEQARLVSLERELQVLELAAQTLAENRRQLEEQRASELAVLELRRQALEASTQQQNTLQQITQLQELQRAQLQELAASQARINEQLQAQIRYGELLAEADRYRAQGLEAQLQVLRATNERLGESEARTQQIQALEQQLAELRQAAAVRAAELAAQREEAELRSLENQRAQLQLQEAQLQALMAQLDAVGQLTAAEQEQMEAIREQLSLVNEQIAAQQQVVEAAQQTAAALREAENASRGLVVGLREAEPLVLQFVPLKTAIQEASEWAERFGLSLGPMVEPVRQQEAEWQKVVGQLQAAQKLLEFSADSYRIMLAYAQRFGGETQQLGQMISQYQLLAREYEKLIQAAERRLEVERSVIPVLEQQRQAAQANLATAQSELDILRAQLRLYDARLERLRAEGASEKEIQAVMQQRAETQRRLEILQLRINELKIQEKILELEIQLVREKALNTESAKVRLLQEQIALQRQLLAITTQTRAELERTPVNQKSSTQASGGSESSTTDPTQARQRAEQARQRAEQARPMARGGPFRAGELLQVGDNPDGTPNSTTEWIQLSAPGRVLTSGDIKVVTEQTSSVFNDGRIVAGLGQLHDLLRAALSVPAASPPAGVQAPGGYSLRDFVLANT